MPTILAGSFLRVQAGSKGLPALTAIQVSRHARRTCTCSMPDALRPGPCTQAHQLAAAAERRAADAEAQAAEFKQESAALQASATSCTGNAGRSPVQGHRELPYRAESQLSSRTCVRQACRRGARRSKRPCAVAMAGHAFGSILRDGRKRCPVCTSSALRASIAPCTGSPSRASTALCTEGQCLPRHRSGLRCTLAAAAPQALQLLCCPLLAGSL